MSTTPCFNVHVPKRSAHMRRSKSLHFRDRREIVRPVHCRASFAKQVFGAAFSANLSAKHIAVLLSENLPGPQCSRHRPRSPRCGSCQSAASGQNGAPGVSGTKVFTEVVSSTINTTVVSVSLTFLDWTRTRYCWCTGRRSAQSCSVLSSAVMCRHASHAQTRLHLMAHSVGVIHKVPCHDLRHLAEVRRCGYSLCVLHEHNPRRCWHG
jgi:hypothetical protein